MNPLFSIIVPVYKTEVYLRQCVDSVLAQTCGDFEVILVDDGSPDGSGAICDEYAARDSRVRVIHKENGGLVSARKAGLTQCRGSFVVNVDSDDYIAPGLLAQLAAAVRAHQPQAILYGLTRFDEAGTQPLQGLLPAGLYAGEAMSLIREKLIQDENGDMAILYGIATAAMERTLYENFQNAVPETVSRGEDLAVTAPLLAACQRVVVLDSRDYFYRSNPASIMHTFREDEPRQLQTLTEHLRAKLGADYENKLDVYTAAQYFDYLDRAMLAGWKEYRRVIRMTQTEALQTRISRARVGGSKRKLIFFLLRHRCYTLLWLLRKVKPRR